MLNLRFLQKYTFRLIIQTLFRYVVHFRVAAAPAFNFKENIY